MYALQRKHQPPSWPSLTIWLKTLWGSKRTIPQWQHVNVCRSVVPRSGSVTMRRPRPEMGIRRGRFFPVQPGTCSVHGTVAVGAERIVIPSSIVKNRFVAPSPCHKPRRHVHYQGGVRPRAARETWCRKICACALFQRSAFGRPSVTDSRTIIPWFPGFKVIENCFPDPHLSVGRRMGIDDIEQWNASR